MLEIIDRAFEAALSPAGVSRDIALELMAIEKQEEIFSLLAKANELRSLTLGDGVELCAIVNARSGRCPEDCAFCAQAARHRTQIEVYPLMTVAEMLAAAEEAKSFGITRFSIVISGKGITSGRDLDRIGQAIAGFTSLGLSPCASLGILTPEIARTLEEAGLITYHHNIETAPAFYPQICTTHGIEERIATARLAKETGFRLCCGGIIGLGETREMRVDLALAIRDLKPDSVPMNFLNPIAGTRLEGTLPLAPLEILKSIAVFRMIMPAVDIRTCGGREKNLRGLQPLMFLAGANATMVGNYLTTTGRHPREDIQDIEDLGLIIRGR